MYPRLCMHPVTSPVTCAYHVLGSLARSSARHPSPAPVQSPSPSRHTQPPRRQTTLKPHSLARGHAGRRGGGAGRARGAGHSAHGIAVYRRLCSPAGSPRSRSWRRSGTNTAAGTTRTSAAGTLLSRPRSTRLVAFLPLTVSI